MKWGQAKANQFKFATEAVQVGDHSSLTAYSTIGSGPEEVAIGEKVITANGHFLNGLLGGQQSGGKTMRHGIGTTILPASTTVLTSALALYGTDCAQLETGKHLWQEISSDVLSHYRRVIFSIYATKQSSADGTLALDWSVDHENVTVTSATADTATDTSLSMGANEHMGKTFLLRDGDGEDQEPTIASNTSDTFTFTTDFATIPSAGDTGDVLDWQSATVKRIDTTSGTVVDTGTVRGYAWWERFFIVFRPTTTFSRVYVRLRSVSSTILFDAAQFEEVSRLGAGISTATTATTLTDTNRGWVEDAKIGDDIVILDGDDEGDCQTISDNTRTVLTVPFAATPSTASVYLIIPAEADCRPTFYQDTSAISMAFGQITGFDVTAGSTLRVGGIKGCLPRFIVDDADQRAIIIAGDNLDADGFRGMKFLRGVSLALEGGSVIARPDKGSVDSGQRMKLSHEGLMAYNSSDVLKLVIYSTGEWEQSMGTSPLQARLVANSTDGFATYDAQGGKWWGVNPDTKHWWLGEPGGDYDAEFTAALGLQIHGGVIVEGTIVGSAVSLQSYLAIGSSTWQEQGMQFQYNAGSPRAYIGDGSSKYFQFVTGGDLIVNGAKVTGIAAGTETAIQNWLMDVTFSSSDLNTVAWTSGTLYMLDGTTYSIDAGNTGNMSALTFIYLDIGTSETVLQTTTTIGDTIGSGKILLAVAQNTATTATFQVLGGRGGILISADSIAANCITAGKIVAGTITSTEIAANTLVVGDLASAVTDLMFDSAAAGNNIQAWVHASDVTLIDGGDIYTNTVTATQIAATTITATQIAANTITAGQIAATTITANEIAANTITAGQIAATTITATEMNVSTLSAIAANLGAVTAGSIVVGSTNKIWLNEGSDGKLHIGGSSKNSAPFRVGPTGAFTATNANITGTVTASAGTIGGFTLSATALTSGALVIDSSAKRISFDSGAWIERYSTTDIRLSDGLSVVGGVDAGYNFNSIGGRFCINGTIVIDENRNADFASLKIGGNYGFDSSRNCVVNSLSIGATSVITSGRVLQNIASVSTSGSVTCSAAMTCQSLNISGASVTGGDPSTNAYFVMKLGGTSYKVPCLAA